MTNSLNTRATAEGDRKLERRQLTRDLSAKALT
jgi:hypothetical protein